MGTDAPRTRRHNRLRALLVVLGVVTTLALIVAGLGVWTVTRSFPTTSGEVDLAGLSANVTVHRDAAGIPQIVAETSGDLFRAQGYVHAQDRFWEMDFRRHVTSGRLSELFGESQVGTDTFIRTLGWRAVAEEEVKLLDPVAFAHYEAYADGVNAYLDTHGGADISLEYAALGMQNPSYTPERWTPADSVAWLKAMAWDLRSNLEDEIDRSMLATTLTPEEMSELHPGYPYAQHPTILGGMPSSATADGEPAAVGDEPAADATAAAATTGGGDPVPAPSASTTSTTTDHSALATPMASLRAALSSVPELLGPAGGEIGSNSWVVAGALTDTGKPILANDPHLGPALPSLWYQVGLRCATVTVECPFDVAGYSFSGLPGVVIGHNARVAWGFTNLGPDVADLYLEKITGDTYEYDGAQKSLAVRNEKITVAGGDDVKIEIRSTEHGPIVSGLTGTEFSAIASDYPEATDQPAITAPDTEYALSLQWTALTPGRTPSAIFAMNSASDWNGFRAAAALFDVPSQNLLYADVDGNIGYQAPGLIPVRKAGDGTIPAPGWTSSYGWNGFIPFESLPQMFNPESGFIVTANNSPVGGDYPYLITKDFDQGYRAMRITERLQEMVSSGTPITTDIMSAIQGDNHSAIAAALVPMLQNVRVDGTAEEAQALFDGWDHAVEADSAAAAYFNMVWRHLLIDVFDSKLPEGTSLKGGDRAFTVVKALLDDPTSSWWTNTRAGTAGRDGMLARALTQAAEEGVELMGPDVSDWEWGRIHKLDLKNATFGESGVAPLEWLFNRGPYGVAGASSVVNAVGWDATSGGYSVHWVPSMRQVISLADWDTSTWINLTGASGHAFHPNYTDQTPLWQHHETRPWAFSAGDVEKAATDTLLLRAR
ncbi:MAG TPA: penicillin acylase family protein [Glaciibacter sp.]|nr:penicillin acylase family protein [Glaciibacter sp.]